MIGLLAGAGILILALLGMPLFLVMGAAALSAFFLAGIPISAVAVEIYKIVGMPTIVSIPLFILAGHLMARSQSPVRLVRLADALFGHFNGGVAIAAFLVCSFFTAFSGASGVTIVALGGLLLPILLRYGLAPKFSLGLLTVCGSLGLLFAPSLPIILYGMVAQVDIALLFKAALVPGILLIVIFSIYALIKSPAGLSRPCQHFAWKNIGIALRGSFWELLLPVGVFVLIYGGISTLSETAVLSVLYVFFMEKVIYRDLDWKNIPDIIVESMGLMGSILLILCCAMGFTNYLVDEEIPMKILSLMEHYFTNKYLFLLMLNIFLLIVGCLMDIFSAIVVVVPLILPIAKSFGIHPVHLAIIFLANLEIGYITPPIGINLFIGSITFKKTMPELYRASVPFLLLSLLALMLITYIPLLCMWPVK
jgi:C4-dicarboxylate transporter, DctM subunit